MNNKPSQLRLGYMGSPDFSVPALASLINANHNMCVVYTQPPRPGGRGKNLQKTPVHNFAEEHGILVRTPGSLKTQESEEMLLALDLDALVTYEKGNFMVITTCYFTIGISELKEGLQDHA